MRSRRTRLSSVDIASPLDDRFIAIFPFSVSCSEEEIMVDIDSFLEGELASINEVLEQFSTDDKKAKKRDQDEMKLLESKNATVSGGKGLESGAEWLKGKARSNWALKLG